MHIRRVLVKEFPNTNQIAERMTVHRKNVNKRTTHVAQQEWTASLKYLSTVGYEVDRAA